MAFLFCFLWGKVVSFVRLTIFSIDVAEFRLSQERALHTTGAPECVKDVVK